LRKTIDVTISTEGRDKGKVFILTEMPSAKSEKWGMRAILALQKLGIQLPDVEPGAGMAGIAAHGAQALNSLPFEELEPLMDEMMTCVKIKPDPSKPGIIRALIEEDIEEIVTRLTLRVQIMELHLGFSIVDLLRRRSTGLASITKSNF
jgi:hypothetical protein